MQQIVDLSGVCSAGSAADLRDPEVLARLNQNW